MDRRCVPVNVVDLLLETLVEHLVSFVDHQHLQPKRQGNTHKGERVQEKSEERERGQRRKRQKQNVCVRTWNFHNFPSELRLSDFRKGMLAAGRDRTASIMKILKILQVTVVQLYPPYNASTYTIRYAPSLMEGQWHHDNGMHDHQYTRRSCSRPDIVVSISASIVRCPSSSIDRRFILFA